MGDRQTLDEALSGAKQVACPHCRRMGMLVGHGLLRGYSERSSDREVRGRRLFCSSRYRRSGCGRTFSVLLASVIAGFTVRTRTLSRFLEAVMDGLCRKAAWEKARPGLTLRSGYRLWARLVEAQPRLRTALSAAGPPPATADGRPIAQMLAHLRRVLGPVECVLAGFQLTFERGLFA